jgi:hypothetical protein
MLYIRLQGSGYTQVLLGGKTPSRQPLQPQLSQPTRFMLQVKLQPAEYYNQVLLVGKTKPFPEFYMDPASSLVASKLVM